MYHVIFATAAGRDSVPALRRFPEDAGPVVSRCGVLDYRPALAGAAHPADDLIRS